MKFEMDIFKGLPAKPPIQKLAALAGEQHDEKALVEIRGVLRIYAAYDLHKAIFLHFKTDYVRAGQPHGEPELAN